MSDAASEENASGKASSRRAEAPGGGGSEVLRRALEAAVRRARDSGQTQWLAHVDVATPFDPLVCYARCGLQDRYYWERAEPERCFFALGNVDEIESSGPGRFEDVDAWASDLRARLHWCGADRSSESPLFLGGFGFADEAGSPSEWKSFPAARFVLPATLGEVVGSEARWIEILRVEPGGDVDSILSEWAHRVERRAALTSSLDAHSSRGASTEADPDLLSRIGAWPSGPEYRVRSDRPHSVFIGQVAAALETIEGGSLEKVVLARRLEVDHDGDLEIPLFLENLRAMYPTCTLVAVGRGEDTFLAATPETLVRLKGDAVETAALAGSAPRGRTPDEDEELAADLRSSAKEQREHAHVVGSICDALGRYCDTVEAPSRPALRQLFGIQHLETPIEARLRRPSGTDEANKANKASGAERSRATGVLALVNALHPTPAVGGVPQAAAVEWLRRFEGLDRGWYASPIGWLDANVEGGGGGDFSVALRSALIRGAGAPSAGTGRAYLFAGAGIVPGSDPEKELAETRIKLRALLAPLTEI